MDEEYTETPTPDLPPPAEQDSEEFIFEDTPNPDLPEFRYSRVWTNPEDFPGLTYTKTWESSDDFPTIETDEQTVRADMQSLFDEISDYLGTDVRSFFAHWLADENFVTWSPYDHTRKYSIGDRVVFNGSSFICLKQCTGEDPEDGEYWMVVAVGGEENLIRNSELISSLTLNELYSSFGVLADLIVNSLRTDYMRAQRYLDHDTSPIDYLAIHDEEISFWTGNVVFDAETGLPMEEQLHYADIRTGDTRYFYWTDENKTKMTYLSITDWPVIVYVYDDDYGSGNGVRPKGAFRFEEEPDGHGGVYKVPVLILGQGTDVTQQTENGMAKIVKHTDGLEIRYQTSAGDEVKMTQTDDGYMDLVGLRKVTALDFSALDSGEFTVTLEGNIEKTYLLDYDGSGNIISITGEGLEVPVSW